jgi:hypothetical protein
MEMSAQPLNPEEPKDAGLSQLYRESGAPEPSADIDQAILAAARREVHAGPRRVGPWLYRWRVPVSIAATIVVSASLVMVMVEEGANRMEDPRSVAQTLARKESPAPETPAPADQAAGSPGAMILQERAETPLAQPAPPAASTASPFPAVPPTAETAPRAKTEQRVTPRPETTAPYAAEVPRRDALDDRPAARLQAAPRRERTEDAVASTLGPRGFTDAPLPDKAGERAAEGAASGALGRAVPADPRQAAGADTGSEERQEPGRVQSAPAPVAKVAPPAKVAPKPRPQTRGEILARDLRDQPPEKWLERVEELRRNDYHGDAEELLAEFRRRFPAHPAAQKER